MTFIKQSSGELLTLTVLVFSFMKQNNRLFTDQARFIVFCFINLKMLSNYATMDTGKEDSFRLMNILFSFIICVRLKQNDG